MVAFAVLLVAAVAVRQALLFVIGIGLGAALAGARFGFTTGWRQLIEARDPRGVIGQVLLLGAAASLSMPLLGAFPVNCRRHSARRASACSSAPSSSG